MWEEFENLVNVKKEIFFNMININIWEKKYLFQHEI